MSFVLPVYNVENFLAECLESILNQDVERDVYEIVCVNDGSKDGSLEILNNYAKKYSNIKIIDKPNGGVSSARNEGIRRACGKWIWFVDSDDYIVENCLSFLLEQTEKKETDIVVFAHKKVEGFKKLLCDEKMAKISFCEGVSNVFSLSPQSSYAGGPYDYIFSREKIKEISLFFDETMKYNEDTKFIFQYKFHCEKGLLIDTPLYCYRNNPQSVMNNINAEATVYSSKRLAELYDDYLALTDDKELKNQFETARCRATRNMLFSYCMYIRDYRRAKQALAEVKKRGWYPYKVKMGIYSKNVKGILINLFNELLTVAWIYLLVCKFVEIKSKRNFKNDTAK